MLFWSVEMIAVIFSLRDMPNESGFFEKRYTARGKEMVSGHMMGFGRVWVGLVDRKVALGRDCDFFVDIFLTCWSLLPRNAAWFWRT